MGELLKLTNCRKGDIRGIEPTVTPVCRAVLSICLHASVC